MEKIKEIEKILLTLSPLERKVLPFLNLDFDKIKEETKLSETEVRRALNFLAAKGLIDLKFEKKQIVQLGVNGLLYLKKGLPERRLLVWLAQNPEAEISKAKEQLELSGNELSVALGALKEKGFIKVKGKKVELVQREKITVKFPEEIFLESLPLELEKLSEEEKKLLKKLSFRKELVKIKVSERPIFSLTELGEELLKLPKSKLKQELIEAVTPEMLIKGSWKGKHFRHYVLNAKVPEPLVGRRHFYYEFLDEIREKLARLGFSEMSGNIVVSEFWNFDALFQPQFHVAREWADSYIVANKIRVKLPREASAVKKIHEEEWNYSWSKEKAMQLVLRPHCTVLSALKLASKPKEGKYFAIARCFRPDVIDATHLTEFNQLEGIVIGKNLNFRNLLFLLTNLVKSIVGDVEIKFLPDYYPFTEPSVEIDIKKDGKWLEVGGAGIFRDEVVFPLMPGAEKQNIRVLAWGLGIDRIAMLRFGLDDIRELFSKKLEFLRKMKLR